MGGEIKRFDFAPLPVDYYFIFFNLSNRLKAPIASQRSGKKKGSESWIFRGDLCHSRQPAVIAVTSSAPDA